MTDDTEQTSQEHEFGPGALLKQTREEQGLSLEEVSTRLKLTLTVLKKIESDDYEGDLPVTFYRGYLKNYAELLGLDEVDVNANFSQYCQKNNLFNQPPPKLEGFELEKPFNSSNWVFKVITSIIILALLFAIYYVVVEKELWKKFAPDNEQEQSLDIDDTGLQIEQSNQSDTPLETDDPVSNDDASSELLIEEEEPEVEDNKSADDLRESSGELSLESNAQNSQETPQPSAVSGGILGLNFSDDCWVRIEDGAGKVLALGIKSAGSSLQLSGETPYHLTLGKASAVQLTYQGESIDLSGYPDTRAAKLTLGNDV
ncbi:RodZ domain-containing protein [Kangiella marina]|uniref:DUF4115 domain-containing protein n=1 Tax=Kangiella marina TaxID=1079178 RepID=A0ABP8INS3_9GAMM